MTKKFFLLSLICTSSYSMDDCCLDSNSVKHSHSIFRNDSYIRRFLNNPVFIKGTKGLLSAFPIYYLSKGRHNYCGTLLKVAFPYLRSFVENDIFKNYNTENSSVSFFTDLIFANLKSRDLSNYKFVSVATTELVIGLLIKYYNCKKIQKNNWENNSQEIKPSKLENFFYKVLPLVLADSIIALFRANEVDFFNKNTSLEIKNDIKFKFLFSVLSSSIFAFLNKEDDRAQCFFAKSFFLVSKFHDSKDFSKLKFFLLALEPFFLWLEPKIVQSEFFELDFVLPNYYPNQFVLPNYYPNQKEHCDFRKKNSFSRENVKVENDFTRNQIFEFKNDEEYHSQSNN